MYAHSPFALSIDEVKQVALWSWGYELLTVGNGSRLLPTASPWSYRLAFRLSVDFFSAPAKLPGQVAHLRLAFPRIGSRSILVHVSCFRPAY